MAESLHPQVLSALRRITDRFLRLGEPTRKHEVRVKLGSKRSELDKLETEGYIRAIDDQYLPRLRALDHEDPQVAKIVRDCTQSVLLGLKILYEDNGPGDFSVQQVETVVRQRVAPHAAPDFIWIGMLFALDFTEYFSSWKFSPNYRVEALGPKEEIIDFTTIDKAWREEMELRTVRAGGAATQEQSLLQRAQPMPYTAPPSSAYGNWEVIRLLGSGGQGVVYLSRSTRQFDRAKVLRTVEASLKQVVGSDGSARDDDLAGAQLLAESVLEYGSRDFPQHCGALKVLHNSDESKQLDKQLGRMKDEIRALRALSHPNVVRVLDENLDERWFVTEYFPEGPFSLPRHRSRYKGGFLDALLAFRPLVEGVAALHDKQLVHRDIKPENVFVSPERGLVLGDFGLVFFADEERARLSETFENVGSRDWMPGWAMSVRLEQVRPNFDVFSLGKLLWSMIAGGTKLQLWYIHEPKFELERLFPNDQDVRWARVILDKCVVEKEKDCLPDAAALLNEVDRVIAGIRHHHSLLVPSSGISCRFCGIGKYEPYASYDGGIHGGVPELKSGSHRANPASAHLGIMQGPNVNIRTLRCTHCGHLEWFQFTGIEDPSWWKR